ncbi:MAG: TetR/AcrR family transcriptional regulator [Hyphomonadaceae bacterium]
MGRAREAAGTERYEKKREAILFAAQQILYRRGVKGMTLADVAAEVGLNATSITYYFRKKEDLATACFLAGIQRLEANMIDAAQSADVRERLTRALKAFFARHRAARLGEESQIVSFSDMRALEQPHAEVLNKAFAGMVQKARALFDGPELAHLDRAAKTARAHLLLEQIFWSAG